MNLSTAKPPSETCMNPNYAEFTGPDVDYQEAKGQNLIALLCAKTVVEMAGTFNILSAGFPEDL